MFFPSLLRKLLDHLGLSMAELQHLQHEMPVPPGPRRVFTRRKRALLSAFPRMDGGLFKILEVHTMEGTVVFFTGTTV